MCHGKLVSMYYLGASTIVSTKMFCQDLKLYKLVKFWCLRCHSDALLSKNYEAMSKCHGKLVSKYLGASTLVSPKMFCQNLNLYKLVATSLA